MTPTILENHITHESGQKKTICVTAVLTALGVPAESFHYTGTVADNRRNAILNRHGFACRSRLSKLGKNATIGQARKKLARLNEGPAVKYMVCVCYGSTAHLMLLNNEGKTVVDTAPRKADKRRIYSVYAVFKK